MNPKINKKMQKALKNESFVDYINRYKARFLKVQDAWGSDNLSGFIESLAEADEDCCGIPSSAFKAYVENEEDWETAEENKEKNPMLYEIYNLIEEREDDLYLDMAGGLDDDIEYYTPEEAAKMLSSYYKLDYNGDYTDEWLEYIKLACKGYDFSDEALIG